MAITLGELAQALDCELHGDAACEVSSVGTLINAIPGQLSFLANSRYRRHLEATKASVVILKKEDLDACPVNALVSSNPYLAYAKAATMLNPAPAAAPGIHPSAVVEEGAQIDAGASIGAQCYIGAGSIIDAGVVIGPGCVLEQGVTVGEGTRLVARVTLCHGVEVGKRCIIHPGAVIGADGFGIAYSPDGWTKVPQVGSVLLGDDVEVGANTTIDRGALEDTVIEEGVKLDNQIQVAHNVHIGAHTAIAGCSGIAGSARIGKRCQIGGASVIVGHIEVADDVHITAMSFVTGNIRQAGAYSSGVPVTPRAEWNKNVARLRQLDDLARRFRSVEKQVGEKESE